MQNPPPRPPQQARHMRIRLPFEKRPGDPGAWSYDHRAGICITLIFFLLIGIALLWWKIDLGGEGPQAMVLVDFPEELTQRPEDEDRDIQQIDDFSNVRNLSSNDAMDLNSELRDDRGTNASELYQNAASLDNRFQANRDAYEEGLRREQQIINAARQGTEEGTERTTTRMQGSVTVSYYFADPVRHDMNLVVPAYQCERGGQVVLHVTLDINGHVTSASVDRGNSTGDDCMQQTALAAARGSRFNIDSSAPSRHRGTITYVFIPQ
ncbi:MAG: energy transducer TonB [Alistipes sp.]|nr:energy transducer TonB [Alistipes sp.]